MSLANHVKKNFAGMLVIGDLHGDYEAFTAAHHHAETHNFFLMSLGDLVDRGPFPFETVSHMSRLVKDGRAGFTIGNHDNKYYRFRNGSKVSFSSDAKRTLADVGPERQAEFLDMYAGIIDTPLFSAMFHRFDDITLVHAASHPVMFESVEKFPDAARSRALYGETNGEVHPDGFPVRLYNWINEVPMGKTVVVGHDRKPIHNEAIVVPLVKTNANGGKAIFIDTGCGKGGFLTGMVVKHDKHFKIDHFVEFK
jgi:hypothetical protein